MIAQEEHQIPIPPPRYKVINATSINLHQTLTSIDQALDNPDVEHGLSTWIQTNIDHLEKDGKNDFNLDSNFYHFHLGYQLQSHHNEAGSGSRTSAYFSYNYGKTKYYDKEDGYQYRLISRAYNLGLTHRYDLSRTASFDFLVQGTYLDNNYRASDMTADQSGYAAALSARYTQAFSLSNSSSGWWLKPYVQTDYVFLHLNDFTDTKKQHMLSQNQHSLRLGVGTRAEYQGQNFSIYANASVHHNFIQSKDLYIETSDTYEKYAESYARLGLGANVNITKAAQFYINTQYTHNLSGKKLSGYGGHLGVRYFW
ncbi:autotransporter domain-containing protein [Basilea psittacipulmonis]|uniref:autotransporter domain-containing protein n=1 Tax=Basilea psittacipulmonis TaxID=1472345 RepID=UPI0013010A5C|nr:autotransporter outer membrane beta-barrel domain-containing protein [Basilea psittacipulmonis]